MLGNNKLKVGLLLTLLICLILSVSCSNNQSSTAPPPAAKAGVLDLTDWDFNQGIVTLDGEWEFYWHKLLTPADFNNHPRPAPTTYAVVPGVWNRYKLTKGQLPGWGYATYRLVIKVDNPDQLKFIKFKNTSSSYKLWINNQLKAVNGVVATEKEQQIPQRKEEIIALPTNTANIELVIQISNFFFADGGFKTDWQNIQLGTQNQINKQVKKQLTLDIFIFGSLFIMALYHLGHFLIAKKHYSSFYFGLLCLVLALRNFSFSSAFFTLFPTDFPFWVRVKLEFFLGYSGAALFATYVYSLFTKQIKTRLIRGYQLLMVVLLLIIVIAPIQIYEPTLLPFELSTLIIFCYLFFIVAREAYQKKEKSTIVLIVGVVLFIGTIVNDILLLNQLINTFYMVQYGLIILIFSQSLVLIFKFTETTRELEAEKQKRIIAEKMRKITNTLVSTLDYEEVLERLLASLAEMVPYTWAAVLLKEDNLLSVQAVKGQGDLARLQQLEITMADNQFFKEIMDNFSPRIVKQKDKHFPLTDEQLLAKTSNLFVIPLLFKDEIQGVLMLGTKQQGIYTEGLKNIAIAFAGQAAISIKNARLFGKVKEMAIYDDLTGLYNRRTFFKLANQECSRAKRYHQQLTVIMLDIDHFKDFNDQYGHLVGDKVLTIVAQRCKQTIRASDIIGRYGGEEFVVLLPNTDLEQGKVIAERLRSEIGEKTIKLKSGAEVSVTISGGVASLTSDLELDDLFKVVDDALYEAKRAGRNCIQVYS